MPKYFTPCPDCGQKLTVKKLNGVPTLYCKKCDQLFLHSSQYAAMTPKKKGKKKK
jgi:hypothetical protein